jgi:hypothetical protein
MHLIKLRPKIYCKDILVIVFNHYVGVYERI